MRIWTILVFLFIISSAFAYPIGIVPSLKTECIEANSTSAFYINFYNGANETKTFNVYIQNLTWASFSNETILQYGEINVTSNTTVPIYVYAFAPENLSEKVYNVTLYVCTVPLQNQTLNFRYCLPGYFILNVEDKCGTEVNNQTWTDNLSYLTLGIIVAVSISLIAIYLIRKTK